MEKRQVLVITSTNEITESPHDMVLYDYSLFTKDELWYMYTEESVCNDIISEEGKNLLKKLDKFQSEAFGSLEKKVRFFENRKLHIDNLEIGIIFTWANNWSDRNKKAKLF